MFGFGKNKEQKKTGNTAVKEREESPELLQRKNIRLDCVPMEKEAVIRTIGGMLWESGYVDNHYADAMLERERSFPTNIGNGIALPHGVESAKKDIRRSGIAVMVFPDGTDWGSERVKLVIGIAGAGDEHLEILARIAEKMEQPEDVERLTGYTEEEVYHVFMGKE